MKKISELTAATSVNDADVVAIVQDGTTKQLPKSLLNIPNDIVNSDGKINLTANGTVLGTGVELPKIEIDTQMSDESVNPVQNNVIKEYIDGLSNYRLIADITLEEDVERISLAKDTDGNPLSLKDVFVLFIGKFANTSTAETLSLSFNNGYVYQMFSNFNITGDKLCGLWARSKRMFKTNTYGVYQSFYPKNLCLNFTNENKGQGLMANNCDTKSDISLVATSTYFPVAKIYNIVFGCFYDTNLLSTGSRILILGVDDNE